MLVALGQSPLLNWFYKAEPSRVIDEVVSGARQLAEAGLRRPDRPGARGRPRSQLSSPGVQLNARVSADLLTTIFHPTIAAARSSCDHRRGKPGCRSMYPAARRGGGGSEIGYPPPGCDRAVSGNRRDHDRRLRRESNHFPHRGRGVGPWAQCSASLKQRLTELLSSKGTIDRNTGYSRRRGLR